ncbi:MAG: hypothetical protein AB7P02_17275 [Alphaproteobacteria bacterium]
MIGTMANMDLMPGMEPPPAWAQGAASRAAHNYLYAPIRMPNPSYDPSGKSGNGVNMPYTLSRDRLMPGTYGRSLFDMKPPAAPGAPAGAGGQAGTAAPAGGVAINGDPYLANLAALGYMPGE